MRILPLPQQVGQDDRQDNIPKGSFPLPSQKAHSRVTTSAAFVSSIAMITSSSSSSKDYFYHSLWRLLNIRSRSGILISPVQLAAAGASSLVPVSIVSPLQPLSPHREAGIPMTPFGTDSPLPSLLAKCWALSFCYIFPGSFQSRGAWLDNLSCGALFPQHTFA